jgi:hypothetical protein
MVGLAFPGLMFVKTKMHLQITYVSIGEIVNSRFT